MKIDTTLLEDPDLAFNKFAKKIQTVYRRQSNEDVPSIKFSREFVQLFNLVCPVLASRFPKRAAFILQFDVIDFAIEGLNDPVLTALWKREKPKGYTPNTVQKYSQNFGVRIARHLYEKNEELKGVDLRPKANPLTLEEYLRQTFELSPGELRVLIAFFQSENRGRKQIAEDLFLSENTIKAHTHSIMRKMKTKTINEAVGIAKKFVP